MLRNIKFIILGAIVGIVFMTITSTLDDISRLAIVVGLCAAAVLVEKRMACPLSISSRLWYAAPALLGGGEGAAWQHSS